MEVDGEGLFIPVCVVIFSATGLQAGTIVVCNYPQECIVHPGQLIFLTF